MNESILFVDDDLRIVSTFQRTLHKEYVVETASSPDEAVNAVLDGRFAVVVSDLNMPGMNGIELLRRVKSLAPQTIGILLTGWADLEAAIDAVNDGHVFRFLRKPCPHNLLRTALDAAIAQNRLLCSEENILRDTLIGAVTLLMDILATSQPETFGHAIRIRLLVRGLVERMNLGHLWEIEAAGILSQIGCASVPPSMLKKYFTGVELLPEEMHQLADHPRIAAELLSQVSRLATVASIVRRQMDSYEVTGGLKPESLTVLIGSQILRVAIDFERLTEMGVSSRDAAARLRENPSEYNAQVLDGLDYLVLESNRDNFPSFKV